MRYILKPLKIAGFILLVVTFLTISFAVDLAVRNEKSKRLYFSRISSFYMKMALAVLGVRVNVINPERLAPGRGSFMVCNHLSYIDVFAIFSNVPAVFVANSELEEAFLLGAIIKYSGGVFVERRGRARLLQDMEGITDMLDLGLNVVLFPEGTTSDGSGVSPFKSSFLAAAEGREVLPLCIKYKTVNGWPITPETSPLVYYYGDITFFEHFFRFLGLKSVTAELTALQPIDTHGLSRKDISDIAYREISACYLDG
ncbi:MAG: lysophospholipid acyltransferase family protein [Candidatus Dadabacteria bacterium]